MEYDRIPQQSVQSAKNSMSSSPFKMFRRFSTPSAPNVGIHDLYMHSDQMEYLHKCTHCGYWNLLSYDDYIDGSPDKGGNILLVNPDGVNLKGRSVQPGSYMFVCRKCGKQLDRWYNGQYVPAMPSNNINGAGRRGYRISQMNAVWVSADALKQEEMNAKSKQSFYNYNLGMPYADIKLQVVPSDITDNGHFTDRKLNRDDYQLIAVGIDWGVKHTIVVMGMKNDGSYDVINQMQIDSVAATATTGVGSDIEAIRVALMPYSPDVIIADVGDSGERISRLIELFGKDRVFGCKYSSDPTSGLYSATGRVAPTWNENSNLVTVDKLVEHKRFIDMLKRGQFGFWRREDPQLLQYIDHWQNVVIRDEEQLNGDMRQVITRKAGDHSASASVYCLIGMDYLREKFFGEDSYDFDYAAVDERLKPEDTDIVKQLSNSGNLFE